MTNYLSDYAMHLEIVGRAQATIDTYLPLLRLIDAELRADAARRDRPQRDLIEATGHELRRVVYRAGLSPATKALRRAAVRSLLGWAAGPDEELVSFDASIYLPPVTVPAGEPRPVPDEVVTEILSRARDPYRVWYWLAVGCGLRCCEIAALDREHITQASLWVRGGKGGKQRTVDVPPSVWMVVAPLALGPVARNRMGERATRQQVRQWANHHLRVLGYPDIAMHQFRHTFGTWYYELGGEFQAQRALGHASPATTAVYARVSRRAMARTAATLPLPDITRADGGGVVDAAG